MSSFNFLLDGVILKFLLVSLDSSVAIFYSPRSGVTPNSKTPFKKGFRETPERSREVKDMALRHFWFLHRQLLFVKPNPLIALATR